VARQEARPRQIQATSHPQPGLACFIVRFLTGPRYAKATDLGKLAPHDLRRTCAKLCRKAGGELEQIQLLLGHASIQTTERYLGTEQALAHAVNDAIGLEM
jgi:integrase